MILIPAYRKDELVAKIADLARKAEKVGVAAPTVTFGAEKTVKIGENEFGEDQYITKIEATVTGTAPKLAGWTLAGVITTVEGTNSVIVKSVPGSDLPAYWRDADPRHCDHCNVNRFRTETFIVRNDAGEEKQVGRSCIKDFLGHASPESILNYCSALFNSDFGSFEDEDERTGSRVAAAYSTEQVIGLAYRAIKLWGYQNRESGFPTRNIIEKHYWTRKDEDRIPATEEDFAAAPAIREWIKSQSGSEFALNAAAFASSDYVTLKAFGYIAAAVMMYIKAQDLIAQQKANSDVNESPIGAAGSKVEIVGTIVSCHRYEGDFGMKSIYTIKTVANQIVKMFTTNSNFDKDDSVKIKGTFKGQEIETYNNAFKGKMINYFMPRARITLA